MESLGAFMEGTLGVEYNQLFYVTVIAFACLSLFQRTRWWILFLPRAFWIFFSQVWVNCYLVGHAECDECLIMRLLECMKIDCESMTRKEMWFGIMGWKTKKQKIRENCIREREDIWHGLVVPEGQQLLGHGAEPSTPRKHKTWGMVESMAQPVKQYSGSVKGHGKAFVKHARYDNGSSVGSFRHASSGSVGSLVEGQAEHAAGQTEQCNGTLGRKKNKKRNNSRR